MIAKVREDAGQTQKEFARVLGWSQPVVSTMENGQRVSRERLAEVDKHFDTVRLFEATLADAYLAMMSSPEHDRRGGDRNVRPWYQLPVPPRIYGAAPAHTALTDVARALIAEATPRDVVVVDGPPGAGKSTAVRHWTAHPGEDVHHDTWWPGGIVQLDLGKGKYVSSREILLDLLQMVGVRAPGAPSEIALRGRWLQALRERERMLIVLDNAADTDQVEPLLPSGTGHMVVVTGRALRHLVLRGATRITVTGLEPTSAVEMLASHLGDGRATAEPDAARVLVKRCGELPLALAVVGERLARMPWLSLADAVEQWSRLGRDDALDAAIELSYRQLPDPAARMFRLLGLLAEFGAISSHSAAALVDASPEDAHALLDVLHRANLIDQVGMDCYRLVDVIRIAAANLGAESDDENSDRAAAVSRLVEFYADTAASAAVAQGAVGVHVVPLPAVAYRQPIPDAAAAMRWWAEHSRMVHWAIQQSHHHGRGDMGWQIAIFAALSWWPTRSDWWLLLLDEGLRSAEHAADPSAIAWLRILRGEAAHRVGDVADAVADFRAGQDEAARSGIRWLQWWALAGLTEIAIDHGRPADEYLQRMQILLAEGVTDAPSPRAEEFARTQTLALTAQIHVRSDNPDEARALLEAMDTAGDDTEPACALLRAPVLADLGDVETALAELGAATETYQRRGDHLAQAAVARATAAVLRTAGRDDEAADADRQVDAIISPGCEPAAPCSVYVAYLTSGSLARRSPSGVPGRVSAVTGGYSR